MTYSDYHYKDTRYWGRRQKVDGRELSVKTLCEAKIEKYAK